MSGKGSKQRSEALRLKRQANFNSRLAENRSAKDSFYYMTKRISWLNDKIAWCKVNGKPYELYIQERESVIWICDKVKELCEKLIAKEKEIRELKERLG